MDDEFTRELKSAWQLQDHDPAEVLQRLKRTRWRPHMALAAELLGCALALLAGIWFAWIASQDGPHRLLFGVSAAVMLVTVPLLTFASMLARRRGLAWDDETPAMLLRIGIRRAEASLQAMRLWRWHVWVIGAFLTVLWALQWLGLVRAFDFLLLYTGVCLAITVATWLWMKWREKRIRCERDACARVLAAIQPDSGPGELP
jgi:hypothetical protein